VRARKPFEKNVSECGAIVRVVKIVEQVAESCTVVPEVGFHDGMLENQGYRRVNDLRLGQPLAKSVAEGHHKVVELAGVARQLGHGRAQQLGRIRLQNKRHKTFC